MTQSVKSASESARALDDDALQHSLEVANFLEAVGRIITRVFGVAADEVDNESDPTVTQSEDE